MGPFTPEFEGRIAFDALPDDCIARIERRVVGGLLWPGRRDRADYQVSSVDSQAISFAARGFLTTYNVGLNRVTVRREESNQLQYHVSYSGWARLAAAHGALLMIGFVLIYVLVPAMRAQVAAYRFGPPFFWGSVVFWGLLWPWILVVFHRGFAERALQRILREAIAVPLSEPLTAPSPTNVPG